MSQRDEVQTMHHYAPNRCVDLILFAQISNTLSFSSLIFLRFDRLLLSALQVKNLYYHFEVDSRLEQVMNQRLWLQNRLDCWPPNPPLFLFT